MSPTKKKSTTKPSTPLSLGEGLHQPQGKENFQWGEAYK
jgi:hypothetical protein